MDSLKHVLSGPAATQLIWAGVQAVSAGVLLALFLLEVAVGWSQRHFTRLVRLLALLSLAASIAAGMVAHRFFETYAFWNANLLLMMGAHQAQWTAEAIVHAFNDANQEATVLGWSSVIVTGILLVAGFRGMRRLVAPAQLPADGS